MPCYECGSTINDYDGRYGVVDRAECFCCQGCRDQFVARLRLDARLGFYVEQLSDWPLGAEPEASPLAVAIIGASTQREPAVKITTPEQYLEHFPSASEQELKNMFDAPAVTCFPIAPDPLYVGDGYGRIRRAP
jgi:hypothetical protein